MGIYSDNLKMEVRLERMRPEGIANARTRNPIVYVPFGAIEWHGAHNPVGLDSLKAHEQLIGAAAHLGGVVYPPIYFGAGGGHGNYDHSYMVEADSMQQIVFDLLRGFERTGYTHAVLVSGHYPNKNEYLKQTVASYQEAGGTMAVLCFVENQIEGIDGDHAAKYETSSMLYLDPALIKMDALAGRSEADYGGADERINYMEEEYHDHPCFGLVGIDPRPHASADVGQDTAEKLIQFIADWRAGKLDLPEWF